MSSTRRATSLSMAAPPLLLLLLLLSILLLLSRGGECFVDREKAALLAFRDRIRLDPNGALQQWSDEDQTPCDWPGIGCSRDGQVTSLQLQNLSLRGRIAPELASLRFITRLNLQGNRLTGNIPPELGSLVNLESLDLADNHLGGEIPTELFNLVKLQQLKLSNNRLTGSPTAHCKSKSGLATCGFCNFRHLQALDISQNALEGELPSCILQAPSHHFDSNCFLSIIGQKSQEDCGGEPFRRFLKQENNTTRSVRRKKAHTGKHKNWNNPHRGHQHRRKQDDRNRAFESSLSTQNNNTRQQPRKKPAAAPAAATSTHKQPVEKAHPQKRPDQRRKRHPALTALFFAMPVLAAVSLVVLVVSVFFYKRRTAAVSPWKTGMSGHLQKTLGTDVPALGWTELQSACEDFSNIIGSSPDSVVFKGTLSDGVEVAVTNIRISATCWTASSEIFFRRKVEALARMKHTHLVNLIGYCAEDEPFARMLLFEYVPNGTLFEHLHNADVEHLDWPARMRVVMGAAYGLEYMHHHLLPPASHSSFDSSAIFLTEDYAAKVADYGFSKLAVIKCDRRKSFSNAIGYDDLEGSDRLAPDFESNIFSFGLLLLEVITGRLPYSPNEGSLLEWAMEFLNCPESISQMVDPSLKNFDLDQLLAICDVVRLCINTDASKRPTMKHIASLLSKDLKMSPSTAQPKNSPLLWAELQILETS